MRMRESSACEGEFFESEEPEHGGTKAGENEGPGANLEQRLQTSRPVVVDRRRSAYSVYGGDGNGDRFEIVRVA